MKNSNKNSYNIINSDKEHSKDESTDSSMDEFLDDENCILEADGLYHDPTEPESNTESSETRFDIKSSKTNTKSSEAEFDTKLSEVAEEKDSTFNFPKKGRG